MSGLCPKRDCGSKRVKEASTRPEQTGLLPRKAHLNDSSRIFNSNKKTRRTQDSARIVTVEGLTDWDLEGVGVGVLRCRRRPPPSCSRLRAVLLLLPLLRILPNYTASETENRNSGSASGQQYGQLTSEKNSDLLCHSLQRPPKYRDYAKKQREKRPTMLFNPFRTAVPFSGTNYLEFEWFVPKTGLRF